MKGQLLSLEQIKEGLADRRLYKVSEVTGLSYPTLKKLANGDDCNYTMHTIRVVSSYINNHALSTSEEV